MLMVWYEESQDLNPKARVWIPPSPQITSSRSLTSLHPRFQSFLGNKHRLTSQVSLKQTSRHKLFWIAIQKQTLDTLCCCGEWPSSYHFFFFSKASIPSYLMQRLKLWQGTLSTRCLLWGLIPMTVNLGMITTFLIDFDIYRYHNRLSSKVEGL